MREKGNQQPVRVVMAVTNDLVTDQRVQKMCSYLLENGLEVRCIGIQRPQSQPFSATSMYTHRFRMRLLKGFGFYAEYTLRLLGWLCRHRADLYVANDLDTLLPMYLVSRWRGKPLVYDSHELFLGVPELKHRPWVRAVWKRIESYVFPRLRYAITVNESIAAIYQRQYGLRPVVVRNLPARRTAFEPLSRQQLGIPLAQKVILMQGRGINVQRGAEELLMAMHPQYGLHNVVLYFIGGGDVWMQLKKMVHEMGLQHKVFILEAIPYQQLMHYTAQCDLGVSLDKPLSMNYRYSLPNKLFDYLAAGKPVLASALPEVQKIVEGYDVGRCIQSWDPAHIAEQIRHMLSDANQLQQWQHNALKAAQHLCWENEKTMLDQVYEAALGWPAMFNRCTRCCSMSTPPLSP